MTTATPVRRTRASKEAPVHVCVRCKELPPIPEGLRSAPAAVRIKYQPREPRPADHGTPRKPRCAMHQREEDERKRTQARHTRVRRVFGIDPDEQAALLEFQHGRCACGRKPGLAGVHTDHDHGCCPGDTSCGQCVRGFTDSQCNREILGRLEHVYKDEPSPALAAAEALVRLASHLIDPPLARLRRGEATPYADVHELAYVIDSIRGASPEDVSA